MLKQVTTFPPDAALSELMEYAVGFEPELEDRAWELYRTGGGAALYGYEDEGEWVGLIGARTNSDNTLEILHLAVHPEDRLKGYGRGLIMETLLLIKPKAVTAVTDEDGADFFRNIGFTVQGFIPDGGGEERFRCLYEAEEEE
ncbi:GNAT family N-acetyltransferase [Paenibacillus sp. M1]|uniref:GNAT family N-acetyltransferase n=1 Tax=Paenibacillus haidiansis TaxID=1574488 RepID=A0ABU7VQV4_9BACL